MKKKRYLKNGLIVIFLILVCCFGKTFAKYVIEEFHGYYLNSKHFYFTSNRLKENNPLYQVNNWSGVGAFNISFDLLSQKNTYVYTDYDIPYAVSFVCPNDVICSVDKPTGTVYSSSNTHSDTITLSVNPQRAYLENESLLIHVEAMSTSPYERTISADFEYVVGKQGVSYEIEDEPNRAYMVLKVTNAVDFCKVVSAFGNYSVGDTLSNAVYRRLNDVDKPKCVSQIISLGFSPNNILLDTTSNIIDSSTYTNTVINGVSYINSLTFNIEPISTVAIKFYKKNTVNNYTYPLNNATSIVSVLVSDPT